MTEDAASLTLRRATDGGDPAWRTRVAVHCTNASLEIRFECRDDLAWATRGERDAELWHEEVVEVFVAATLDDPFDYLELQVNPLGALFDARVSNPAGDRSALEVERAWDWPGIEWRVGRLGRHQDWWAEMALPWLGLGLEQPPRMLRANFFRIERPRGTASSEDEYCAWSPTGIEPPDFHRPRCFGLLVIGEVDEDAREWVAAFRRSGRPVLVVPLARGIRRDRARRL